MTKPSNEEYTAILANDQLAFTEQVFHQVSPGNEYISNWHIDCIVEHLQAVERGEILRLNVNMPPRELKSISITIAWTAWLLGRDPTRQIIAASYSHELATRHSTDTRLVIESEIFKQAFPDTKIARDQNQKDMFQTTQRGFRKATSVGGSILGMGADYLILDDPVKADEALSETIRNKTNAWIDQSFLTRQNKPGQSKVVLVMQRLHENDPAGHLIERGDWHNLILPAEFNKKTFIEVNNRKWRLDDGELLNPGRLTREVLDQKLSDLGPYGYAGQYQQNPAPVGGGEFKKSWISYYNNLSKNFTPQGMNIYILYDPANEKKKKQSDNPDFTAMMVIGMSNDNNYYLLDIVRDRLNPTERIQKLITLHKKWNKLSLKPPKVACEKYGMMTDSYYLRKAQADINYRFQVIEVGGIMKKEDRIRRLIPIFEAGRMYLPRKILYTTIEGDTIELVDKFIEEMMTFPVGRHDDMLDALARVLDENVYASFPKVEMVLNRVRGSYRDELNNFREDDISTW